MNLDAPALYARRVRFAVEGVAGSGALTADNDRVFVMTDFR